MLVPPAARKLHSPMSETCSSSLALLHKILHIHSHTPSVYYNICISVRILTSERLQCFFSLSFQIQISPAAASKYPVFFFFTLFFFSKPCCQALIDSFSSDYYQFKMLEKNRKAEKINKRTIFICSFTFEYKIKSCLSCFHLSTHTN